MADGMFVMRDDGSLVEMSEALFESEKVFQGMLAEHPGLIPGSQVDPERPRRWVLVKREAAVPRELGGSAWWSADHLLLDQDGIPTIVEVKRSTDPRIRREVVAQMLDYAANAVAYVPVEQLRAWFETTCERAGRDPVEVLGGLTGDGRDADGYWQAVKLNLQAGKIRMVFVADVIPPELQLVVEFMNEQMDPAEVLAVEIRQFAGGDLKTLVPRVIGRTAEAGARKGSAKRTGREWDEPSFMADLEERRGSDDTRVAQAILGWMRERGFEIRWGQGSVDGSFWPEVPAGQTRCVPFRVYSYGRVKLQFPSLASVAPFDEESKRLKLVERLNAIAGVSCLKTESRGALRSGWTCLVLRRRGASSWR